MTPPTAASGAGAPAGKLHANAAEPRELITTEELDAAVRRVAKEISDAYDDGVVLVAVLKGSVPFLADLVRHLTIGPEVDFLAISRYAPGTGRVRIVKDLEPQLPPGGAISVRGQVESMNLAFTRLGLGLIAAVFAVRAFRPASPAAEMRVEITTPPTTDPVSLAISPARPTEGKAMGWASGRRHLAKRLPQTRKHGSARNRLLGRC